MTPRDMLIDALREKGLLGIDEDEFVDVLSDLGIEEDEGFAETHDWAAEMRAARTDGLIDDLGCSWVRLSRKWWADHLDRLYALEGDRRVIVDLLAGDGALEAEPKMATADDMAGTLPVPPCPYVISTDSFTAAIVTLVEAFKRHNSGVGEFRCTCLDGTTVAINIEAKPPPVIWRDVREVKDVGTWHAVADLNGHRAEVWTLPRDGSGKDWAAEAGGITTQHRTHERARWAAEKRLRAAAKAEPRPT